MRWIEKCMTGFLMASTSSINMQSSGKIVKCATAVGAKTWCLYVFYRQDRQTAGIKFTHMPKIRFSPQKGDSLHRFTSNFAGPTGTVVRLPVQNFSSIATGGWECGPQNIKNFHFLIMSRPAIFRVFYTTDYPALVFQIPCDSHHRLRSYC